MDSTPVKFSTVSRWKIVLRSIANLVVYFLVMLVIIGPSLILIFSSDYKQMPCVRPTIKKIA